MPLLVTRATGYRSSVAVRRPPAEGTHDLLDGARQLPDGSGSRGVGGRPVGLSTASRSPEVVASMKDAPSYGTPLLRPRTVLGAQGALGASVRPGPLEVWRCP
jgi:hypothetical protein